MDFGEIIVGGFIFNFIGGTIRWVYGTIWRTIFKRKKFKFKEYLYGPEKSDDVFDTLGHSIVNRTVGYAFILIFLLLIFYKCGKN